MMNEQSFPETWLLVGCSRGFGAAFAELCVQKQLSSHLIFVSRKIQLLERMARPEDYIFQCDLSKSEQVEGLIQKLQPLKIHRMIYFAGGGPYGSFPEKSWKDHEWAWQVSFVSCAYLIHHLWPRPELKQMIAIGSNVAETAPDPAAASYAAAKHALRGLVTTLQAENHQKDVRLFSPGYMDTSLLPATAWPRTQSGLVQNPHDVAEDLWQWMHDDNSARKNKSLVSF